MYLINTHTLELESFPDERGIRYAILSHRWGQEEVLFHDMPPKADAARLQTIKGFAKISKCCKMARQEGLRYAWVDTCCIDKSSSAELQEAINSMFRWYAGAVVCYAYLSDVPPYLSWNVTGGADLDESSSPSDYKEYSPIRFSRWFERGWTLQELLAPKTVVFYDVEWSRRGTREELSEDIELVTRIPAAILSGGYNMDDPPLVAEIMGWARGRKTTRIEDRAYCLLGLFNVNMPLLYGEGNKAFKRLQEEIIRNTSDLSIFAWAGVQSGRYGLLAESPDNFTSEVQLSRRASEQHRQRRQPELVTNQGISLFMDLIPWKPLVYFAVVAYMFDTFDRTSVVGIFLRIVNTQDCYIRVTEGGEDLKNLRLPKGSWMLKDCPVRVVNSLFDSEKLAASYSMEVYKCEFAITGSLAQHSKDAIQPCGPGYWRDDQSCLGLQTSEMRATHMAVIHPFSVSHPLSRAGALYVGVDHRFLPYCIFGVDISEKLNISSWLHVKGQSLHNGPLEQAKVWKRVADASAVDSKVTIVPDVQTGAGKYLYLARNVLVVMAGCDPEMLLVAMEARNVFIRVSVKVKEGKNECKIFFEMRGPDVREAHSVWRCKVHVA